MSLDELFKRTVYIAEMLKREEVIKHRFISSNRDLFEKTLAFMQQ